MRLLLLGLLSLTSALGAITNDGSSAKVSSHLKNEQSPYLQQHVDNPVDWYPWGDAAFKRAKEENKLIFLSVGYSTCHWCHVMERESFMDPTIAAILNENFISIKIDREERPDIDRVYMRFVQATTGSGGWPLNVWMTPDLKPFFGGTYFPPQIEHGRPGFSQIAQNIAGAWKKDAVNVEASANAIYNQLKEFSQNIDSTDNANPETDLSVVLDRFEEQFDTTYGGFSAEPKFPAPSNLQFLNRATIIADTDERTKVLGMVTKTLDAMMDGGIYDHVGGGFHRYSVDKYWHVPHFEKMLYDQAQLTTSYLEAYQITKNEDYARVVRRTLDYVKTVMTSPSGGFYSAEDADSLYEADKPEHGEGVFYIWKQAEIAAALGESAELFNYVYGVKPFGNAPADPHKYFTNQNILKKQKSFKEAAIQFEMSAKEVSSAIDVALKLLHEKRANRPRPKLDDKILTSWNGLMISAYARAYSVLDDPGYLLQAAKAAQFIRKNLYDETTQTLIRSYRGSASTIEAFSIDYACMIQACLDLYEAGFDHRWLEWAEILQNKQNELFWDKESGGYFASHVNDGSVILAIKESYDGAIPSDNSIAALNLQRLSAMLNKPEWSKDAQTVLNNFSNALSTKPTSMAQMLVAWQFSQVKPKQIVIAGRQHAKDVRAILELVNSNYLPNKAVLLADGKQGQAHLAKYTEAYGAMEPIDGVATAFICEDFVCELPTNSLKRIEELLQKNK
ncbi:MAG: thioredoxin domain-containing protein [Opitutaceae bacterium]